MFAILFELVFFVVVFVDQIIVVHEVARSRRRRLVVEVMEGSFEGVRPIVSLVYWFYILPSLSSLLILVVFFWIVNERF